MNMFHNMKKIVLALKDQEDIINATLKPRHHAQ